jgi:hypothetical protein
MVIRSCSGAAATILTASAVLVRATPCAGEWRRIDSPNFVVVGDVGARRLREIAVEFEGFRETLSRVLASNVTSAPVPTVVVVFPNGGAFNPVKPKYKEKRIDLQGMFMSRRDAPPGRYVTDHAVRTLDIRRRSDREATAACLACFFACRGLFCPAADVGTRGNTSMHRP